MKHATKTADLVLAARNTLATAEAEAKKEIMINRSTDSIERAHAALDAYRTANTSAAISRSSWQAVPLARRELAETTLTICLHFGRTAAATGQEYSGITKPHATINPQIGTPTASTETSAGDNYSGTARKYRKTDASHIVTLAPDWCPLLAGRQEIAMLSAATGLNLIGIHPDGRHAWVQRAGKQIKAVIGWIATFGEAIYHSTESQEHADRGLARQLRIEAQSWHDNEPTRQQQQQARKADRRARLIARLCSTLTASIADARDLGYCPAGIANFQQTHGISDTATLRQLMDSNDARAQRLALHIARKVTRKTQQA